VWLKVPVVVWPGPLGSRELRGPQEPRPSERQGQAQLLVQQDWLECPRQAVQPGLREVAQPGQPQPRVPFVRPGPLPGRS
jgi:hypothetical protein